MYVFPLRGHRARGHLGIGSVMSLSAHAVRSWPSLPTTTRDLFVPRPLSHAAGHHGIASQTGNQGQHGKNANNEKFERVLSRVSTREKRLCPHCLEGMERGGKRDVRGKRKTEMIKA